MPGYYKWWATKDSVLKILNKVNISFNTVEKYLEKNKQYFCVYVGAAIKESLRNRLNWHINQINNLTNVKNGTLSTLRQTISSLFGKNMLDIKATNDFIDNLWVEYFLSDKNIKSIEAKEEIHKIEYDLLHSEKLYILNIQDNNHKLSQKKEIKTIKKNCKTNLMLWSKIKINP